MTNVLRLYANYVELKDLKGHFLLIEIKDSLECKAHRLPLCDFFGGS